MSVDHLKGSSLRQALTLSTNIGVGQKGLPRTNTLAYYENSLIVSVKSFITLLVALMTASSGSTVVEHSSCHPKIEGLSRRSLKKLFMSIAF